MRKKDKLLIQEVRKRGRPAGSRTSNTSIKKHKLMQAIGSPQGFKKGNGGGPGRPVGSRNKVTVALEKVGEKNAIRVYNKVMELALEGDTVACKLILDRVFPVRKGRKISLDIQGSVSNPKDISALSTRVTDMMVNGEISPEESLEIGNKIEQHLKILTDVDIINKIEGTCEKLNGKV